MTFSQDPNIYAGIYSVTVSAKGFKALTVTVIDIGASETRDLGRLTLTLGNITDSISVTSEIAAVLSKTDGAVKMLVHRAVMTSSPP